MPAPSSSKDLRVSYQNYHLCHPQPFDFNNNNINNQCNEIHTSHCRGAYL